MRRLSNIGSQEHRFSINKLICNVPYFDPTTERQLDFEKKCHVKKNNNKKPRYLRVDISNQQICWIQIYGACKSITGYKKSFIRKKVLGKCHYDNRTTWSYIHPSPPKNNARFQKLMLPFHRVVRRESNWI